ncbi:MAG: pyridoxamine kinase [Oscillospiraceae bacterium]
MNHTPRVAAVHDLSGFGRCSLTVVLPVLAAMGAECCPLPTAYLSAHTAFPKSDRAVFLDLTDQMVRTTRHWAELGVEFDAIYSGFLGSEAQIGLLGEFIREFRGERTLVVVDPVMGDWGKPYRTYTPDLCRRMGELAEHADVITPNLTEAALLLGEEYDPAPSEDKARSWLERLSLGGTRSVVLTGVHPQEGQIGAGCFDRETGEVSFPAARQEPGVWSGTGDLFASVLLGALLRGESLHAAAQLAVEFVRRCAADTAARGGSEVEGVMFEGLLGELGM